MLTLNKQTMPIFILASALAASAHAQLPPALAQLMSQGQQQNNTPAAFPGAAPPAQAVPATSALPPRKPGAVRFGIVEPKAQMGQGMPGSNMTDSLRTSLVRYLSGPSFEAVPITAMLPSQIDEEARSKSCDYVLYTSVNLTASSRGGFGLLKKGMPLASMIPMVGVAAGVANAAARSGAVVNSASGIVGMVKAKSEMTLAYRLMAPGNTNPVLANSASAKAKQDGEDLLTPLIEQAAGAIVNELSRKR